MTMALGAERGMLALSEKAGRPATMMAPGADRRPLPAGVSYHYLVIILPPLSAWETGYPRQRVARG